MKFRRAIRNAILAFTAIMTTPAFAELHFKPLPLDDGTSAIGVFGRFEMTDDLSGFEDLVRKQNAVVVTFVSEGGSIFKALELGRSIRKLGLETFQPNNSICVSACAFAFMGGNGRYAQNGAIGLHRNAVQPGYYSDVNEAVSAIQQATAEILVYLMEMDVDPTVLQVSLTTDAADMHFMSSEEMDYYRVTLAPDHGHRRTAAR